MDTNKVKINVSFNQAKHHQKYELDFEEKHILQLDAVDMNDRNKNFRDRWFQIESFTTFFQRGLGHLDYLFRPNNQMTVTFLDNQSRDIIQTLDFNWLLYIRVKNVTGIADGENRLTDIVGIAKLNPSTFTYELINSIPFQIGANQNLEIYLQFKKYRPIYTEYSQGGTTPISTQNDIEPYYEFYSASEEKMRRVEIDPLDNRPNDPDIPGQDPRTYPIYRTQMTLQSFYTQMD